MALEWQVHTSLPWSKNTSFGDFTNLSESCPLKNLKVKCHSWSPGKPVGGLDVACHFSCKSFLCLVYLVLSSEIFF
jgi:hypothetical protein